MAEIFRGEFGEKNSASDRYRAVSPKGGGPRASTDVGQPASGAGDRHRMETVITVRSIKVEVIITFI